MNKLRRKTLQRIFDQLSNLREEIEAVKEEEDESRENMPENLQGSERYEQSETASSNMDEAMEYISSACDMVIFTPKFKIIGQNRRPIIRVSDLPPL